MMRPFRAEARALQPSYPFVTLERPAHEAGWPIRFQTLDPLADGGVRLVELNRDHLVLRRRNGGVPMKLRLALSAYEGLAVALLDPQGEDDGIAIVLVHADPSLSVTLYSAPHVDDVVAEWRGWSAALGVPMLVTEADGSTRPAYAMIGRVTVGEARPRRRRRGVLKHRRPSILRRRAPGRPLAGLAIHRGERELIARD